MISGENGVNRIKLFRNAIFWPSDNAYITAKKPWEVHTSKGPPKHEPIKLGSVVHREIVSDRED